MSTSLLYHTFNLKGVKYKSTKFKGNRIIFSAEMTDKLAVCPACKSKKVVYKGRKSRMLLLGKFNKKIIILKLIVHRIHCKSCEKIRWPHLPFAPGKKRYTNSFAILANELLRFGTIKSTAQFLGVSWDLVKSIHGEKLQKTYKNIELRDIEYISIDEFSIKKGHQYMTIVIDLKTGRIIHSAQGKSKDSVADFLKELHKKAKRLKAVTIDMGRPYFAAATENLPGVDIVFDKFHVSSLINRALDDIRREQQRSLNHKESKVLKGTRFLLLSKYDNLAEDHKTRLNNLLQINKPLFIAHSMKEQLNIFWKLEDMEKAKQFLNTWCKDALNTGIKQFAKVAKTISSLKTAFLNYFKHRITSGRIEGINNKIKTLKRQAYGFRDMVYFKLRLFHLHKQGYSLSG